ncbi:MAG: HD domain-containing protein [Deltaproteobacteria bacterium]|nr:HD domain-containing protein [Deltaproteobacteria bacterium]
MKPYQKVEKILRPRLPDWWDGIIQLIPELEDLKQTPQPPQYHAEGDVAAHTQLAVEACPPDGDPDLLWAALLHDVGKAAVTKLDGDRITAHGHDIAGAELAQTILDRLQMPAKRLEKIVWAVRHHTFHLSWNLNAPGQATRRQKRLVADQRFPLLLELLRVDSLASLGNPRGMRAYDLYKRLRATIDTNKVR